MEVRTDEVINLSQNDLSDIKKLYEESYPDNSFDPRMLETSMYFGLRKNGKLISISGIHVFSKIYKVAALGNITTHPDFRGLGYGQKVTAYLCKILLKHDNTIGLNVNIDNAPAIKCYKNLGFEVAALYMEYMIERKIKH
jgi:predicted GNAT family acetyltransferase